MSKPEYILCSAVWYKDIELKQIFDSNVNPVNVNRGLVFCGFRHCHCMYTMCSVTGLRSVQSEVGEYVQGFLTSKNRFVNREEAMLIAIESKQLKESIMNTNNRDLFSEDLW